MAYCRGSQRGSGASPYKYKNPKSKVEVKKICFCIQVIIDQAGIDQAGINMQVLITNS